MNATEQILKQDVLGRVWTPRSQREATLDEFERSGLPATRFAEQIGVKYQTFVGWIAKRRKARLKAGGEVGAAPAIVASNGWVEAVMARAEGVLVLHLPGGAHLEVQDSRQAILAADILRALESPGGVRC